MLTTGANNEIQLEEHPETGFLFYNPNDKPFEELPVIYGFNNGGHPGWYSMAAISEDGVCLAGHICSHDSFGPGDLGMRSYGFIDRNGVYAQYYPEGYRTEYVFMEALTGHKGFQAVVKTANSLSEDEQKAKLEKAGLLETIEENKPGVTITYAEDAEEKQE